MGQRPKNTAKPVSDAGATRRPVVLDTSPKPASSLPRARLFISYKRNVSPDSELATQVFEALRQVHDVFIDQTLVVGKRWAEQIETELRRADFLISFLSAEAVRSEMVVAEIETAHRLAKGQNGRPVILPVRVDFREPFHYPLSARASKVTHSGAPQ
jgi:hypothetical protein